MTDLISAAGLKRLENEYHYLWRVERPKVCQGVSEAAAEGDRSENAEYIYGCWVGYEDEAGDARCYQLVGPDEIDVTEGRISIDSPVGQALLHKKLDDEVFIKRPNGDLTVYITSISATRQ